MAYDMAPGTTVLRGFDGRITVNPAVCGGRPCIRGMRIRVIDILEMLAGGDSRETVLDAYPYLEDGDISAALAFAVDMMSGAAQPAA
jgi:uncharacterized protein (DUF433 family)